jgi:mannose-1-phosphate guanylyltransferase
MSTVAVRTALIVAGGRGTRLRPLTYTTPKPLIPFCGAPFLEGVVRRLAAAGVGEVLLVVGAETAPFGGLTVAGRRSGVEVSAVPEPEPLDTAGGVRAAAERLEGPVLVLNGDILTDVDLTRLVHRHVESGADATITLTRVDDTSPYGVAVREGTRVVEFVEKPAPGTLPGHDTVNAGTYVVDTSVLLAHPQGPLSFEHDVFPGLLARGGHLEGFVWEGVWQDLGTPDRYREGHRLALRGAMAWPTLDDVPEVTPGVRIAPSAAVSGAAEIHPPALVLPGADVAPGAIIGPDAVIGRGSRISEAAVVRSGAILHSEVRLGRGVEAVGLVAGDRSRVLAGARLGHDVVLGAETVIERGERLRDGERRPTED